LEKNRDSIAPSVLELFERSTNPLVRLLFGPDAVWSAQQFDNLATQILGEGITKAEHDARNRSRLESMSTTEGDDALAMANSAMKSSRRGQSMRKSR
jgi:myosin heavy subunit